MFGIFVYGSKIKEDKLENQINKVPNPKLPIQIQFLILQYLFPDDHDIRDKERLQEFFPEIYDEINEAVKAYTECPPSYFCYNFWMARFLLSGSTLDKLHEIRYYNHFQLRTSELFELETGTGGISNMCMGRPKWTVTMNFTDQNIYFYNENPKYVNQTMLLDQFPLYTKFIFDDHIEMKTIEDYKLYKVHLNVELYSTVIIHYVHPKNKEHCISFKFKPFPNAQYLERVDYQRVNCAKCWDHNIDKFLSKTKTYACKGKSFGLREYTTTINENDNDLQKIIFGFWVNTE
jgi:hypothetical protein